MKLIKLLRLWILLLFVYSMYPWFMWHVDPLYLTIITSLLIGLTYFVVPKAFDFSQPKLGIIVLLFFFLWISKALNVFGWLNNLLHYFSICMLLFLRVDIKAGIVKFITKWFAVILGISIVPYLLFVLNVPLPHQELQFDGYSYQMENYYFFITNPHSQFRFRGPFLEPGHLTMGLAPLLYLNQYNVKNKFVLVLIFAQILTFSLSGYLVLFFGIIWLLITSKQKKRRGNTIANVIALGVLIAIVGHFVGFEMFSESIIGRLEYDSTRGTIVGNNRTSEYFDSVYQSLLGTPFMWTGIPFDFSSLDEGVAGFKRYVVEYGFIGVALVVLFYICLIKGKYNRYNWGLVILILLLLYQNAYPLWWCLIICAGIGSKSSNILRKIISN